MTGEVICVVNRAPWPLSVMKDGRSTVLQPGDNYVNSDLVRFARQQHPVPGTQDPYNPYICQFLVGVKARNPRDQKDPIDAIPADVLAMLPNERLDRTKMPLEKQRVIQKDVPFPKGRVQVEAPSAEGMMSIPEGARGSD